MTWIQTSRGLAFDLLHPRPEDVDFEEIGYTLAEITRFAGHVRGYCVAQHCATGARLFRAWGDREAALHFLLHDAHEFAIGDQTTPAVEALDMLSGVVGTSVSGAVKRLKFGIDAAIFKAAGLVNQRTAAVKLMDLRMLRTERDQLLGPAPKPWHESIEAVDPLPITLKVAPRAQAARDWLDLLDDLAPARRR